MDYQVFYFILDLIPVTIEVYLISSQVAFF